MEHRWPTEAADRRLEAVGWKPEAGGGGGYNALNHAQFDKPNTTPSNSAFGTVTGELGHGQRQLTFAIKLLF